MAEFRSATMHWHCRKHVWSRPSRSRLLEPPSMKCCPGPDRPGYPSTKLTKRDSLVRRRGLANHSVIFAGIPKSWSPILRRAGDGTRRAGGKSAPPGPARRSRPGRPIRSSDGALAHRRNPVRFIVGAGTQPVIPRPRRSRGPGDMACLPPPVSGADGDPPGPRAGRAAIRSRCDRVADRPGPCRRRGIGSSRRGPACPAIGHDTNSHRRARGFSSEEPVRSARHSAISGYKRKWRP